jgi:hypothetical protein
MLFEFLNKNRLIINEDSAILYYLTFIDPLSNKTEPADETKNYSSYRWMALKG